MAGSASSGKPQNNGGGNCAIIAYDGYYPINGYVADSTPVPAYPDFTPIITGKYSCWSYECIETLNTHTSDSIHTYYTNMVSQVDNDILQAELNNGNSALYGPVTAVRLSEMRVSRASVGGEITPN